MATLAGDMAFATANEARSTRRAGMVRLWLWALVALVVLMVAVGGATRLTGSGLSITEWKPVTGAVPPLSEGSWLAEFDKYRASSQYGNLNRGMTLDEFRTIYWWEWGHRQLGRFLGLFFFAPLLAFWLTGRIGGASGVKLLAVGALGGLQAAVGWIMVASGLQPGMTAVAPLKLTLHLTIASAILGLLVWFAVGLREPAGRSAAAATPERSSKVANAAFLLLTVVFLQIALGGLVAGSKAGWTFNTWPLMDGALVPPAASLFAASPLAENFVSNPALVQFNHRIVAYLLMVVAFVVAWRTQQLAPSSKAAFRAWSLAGLVLAQATLGVVTLLLAVPVWAGLAHQLGAVAVLIAAAAHARLCVAERARDRLRG